MRLSCKVSTKGTLKLLFGFASCADGNDWSNVHASPSSFPFPDAKGGALPLSFSTYLQISTMEYPGPPWPPRNSPTGVLRLAAMTDLLDLSSLTNFARSFN